MQTTHATLVYHNQFPPQATGYYGDQGDSMQWGDAMAGPGCVDQYTTVVHQHQPYGAQVVAQPRIKQHNPYTNQHQDYELAMHELQVSGADTAAMIYHLQSQMYSTVTTEAAQSLAAGGQPPHAQLPQPAAIPVGTTISLQQLLGCSGQLLDMSRTSTGSSFIQAALRDGDPTRVDVVWQELKPFYSDLLLDAHGCYVMRTLMEAMQLQDRTQLVAMIAQDEQLLFSMCTHSLHTRRVVQYLLELGSGEGAADSVVHLMVQRCREIATTQQGCIAMQRALDHQGPLHTALCSSIFINLYAFSSDPFANYVVQYLLEKGDRDACSAAVMVAFTGHVRQLACNKFASNVVEKCLLHLSPEAQHCMLVEMYDADEAELESMLQDSFGNYIIQSSIALAPFRDLWMIDQRLRPALKKTPYGYKIEARLDRRLRGKAVASRGAQQPAGGLPAPTSSQQPSHQHNRKGQRHASRTQNTQHAPSNSSFGNSGEFGSRSHSEPDIPDSEEAW